PYLLSSADGEKWDSHDVGGKFMLRRLAYGNKLYVGVGDRGRRSFSTNATKWEDVPGTRPVETLIDVAFGGGTVVGGGRHGLRMLTADGKKWTDKQMGEEGEHLNSVVWAKDRFVAIGVGATLTSTDGKQWRRHPNKDAPTTVAWCQGRFVGVRWKGRLMTSTEGIEWTQTTRLEHHVEAVAGGELA